MSSEIDARDCGMTQEQTVVRCLVPRCAETVHLHYENALPSDSILFVVRYIITLEFYPLRAQTDARSTASVGNEMNAVTVRARPIN